MVPGRRANLCCVNDKQKLGVGGIFIFFDRFVNCFENQNVDLSPLAASLGLRGLSNLHILSRGGEISLSDFQRRDHTP